jgi:hypothetical protein
VLDELLICARYDELPEILTARFGDVADGVVLPPLDDQVDNAALRVCISELRRRR